MGRNILTKAELLQMESEEPRLSIEQWEALHPWERLYKLAELRRKTWLVKESVCEMEWHEALC